MTTTAFDDQFTVGTQTIEPVRQPYDTVAILRRNIAVLEVALKQQTHRAEAAEAELAKLAQQKPVAHIDYWKSDGTLIARRQETSGGKLYAAPAPAPHKGATHCDDCGLTWLDDGLNPLGCPYCKVPVPAPAVPADCRQRLCKEGKPYPRSSCAVCGQLSPRHRQCDALLQSAEVRHD